ncbi:MAG TPA: hypothetical protein VF950_19540 [Planctomycetota bacterium]
MNDEYGVYIPGAAAAEERTIDALSRAAELSRIDAQMLLASPLPKRVRSESTSSDAAARVRLLREGGLDAFVVTHEALGRVKPVRAKSFRFDGGSLRLEPPEASFEPGALRLIVLGEILSSSRVDQSVSTPRRYGPPVVERVKGERHTSGERFVHLYGESHARVVEIRPQSFNFRALGTDFGPALSGNVATFLERLRRVFPDVRSDDSLLRFPPMPDDLGKVGGTVEHEVHKEDNEAQTLRTSILIALDLLRR